MENNPDGHLLNIFICLFLYVELDQVIILWKVSKRNKKDQKPIFLLSLLTLLEFYLHLQTFFVIQLPISDETNQHPRDTTCNYIRRNRQFRFLDLTLPKNGFRF